VTHADLVVRATKWLKNTIGCGFVLTELSTASMETPDAIGWTSVTSYLVECKTSRSDFLADRKKLFRAYPEQGMGVYRYYMTPPGLVNPEELPSRWGLLWVYGRTVKVMKQPEAFDPKQAAFNEQPLLCSALRRVHLRGDLVKIYTMPERGGVLR
jgi:hypothetical protein